MTFKQVFGQSFSCAEEADARTKSHRPIDCKKREAMVELSIQMAGMIGCVALEGKLDSFPKSGGEKSFDVVSQKTRPNEDNVSRPKLDFMVSGMCPYLPPTAIDVAKLPILQVSYPRIWQRKLAKPF